MKTADFGEISGILNNFFGALQFAVEEENLSGGVLDGWVVLWL